MTTEGRKRLDVHDNPTMLRVFANALPNIPKAQEFMRGSADEIEQLRRQNEHVVSALEKSVTLQSHYASLLNMHDGGERMTFASAEEWLARLAAVAGRTR